MGAVLTGGSSRRMGTDKAFVAVDGRPMVVRVAAALLAGGAERVVAVGGDAERLRNAGLDTVADLHPGEGPLGGIVTALGSAEQAGAAVLLVSACDHPWLDVATVAGLVAALSQDGPVERAGEEGRSSPGRGDVGSTGSDPRRPEPSSAADAIPGPRPGGVRPEEIETGAAGVAESVGAGTEPSPAPTPVPGDVPPAAIIPEDAVPTPPTIATAGAAPADEPSRGRPDVAVAVGADGRDALVLALAVPTAGPVAGSVFAAGGRSLGALLDAVAVRRLRPLDPQAVADADDPSALRPDRNSGGR